MAKGQGNACGAILAPRQAQVTAFSTANSFIPLTDWVLATGVDTAKVVWRNVGSTTLTTQPAYQTAPVRTDKPDYPQALGVTTLATNNEAITSNVSLSSATSAKFWIRFGILYKATSGTFGTGNVWMQATLDAWGQIVTREASLQLAAETTTSEFQAVTPWMPAIFADKVKFALAFPQQTNLYIRPVFQTSTTLPGKDTSNWDSTNMGSEITTVGETCTAELPSLGTPFAAKMWVRFGIQYRSNVAGRAEGNVIVSVAVRTV
ncbi:MAG: hypothetical protein WC538_21205 [Thermoanaerobaculia bacterium]|jgi:hypothetical protein